LEDRIALNYSFGATPFQWVNLVPGSPGVFTIIQAADDAAAPVNLGTNSFNFYGTTYTGATSIWASSNGLITFGSGDASFIPTDLTSNPYQASISPLWYDLFKFSGGPMILGELDAANNQLIIEWSQVRDYQSSNLLTFEAVLQLNTGVNPGNITINYSTVDWFGSGAGTVGIKDVGPQGPNMVLVAYRAQNPLVGNNEAIQFSWINPIVIPNISSISPGTGTEGSSGLGLTVNGSNFTTSSMIEVNGVGLTTTFVNGTQLQATLTSSMLAEEGPLSITVLNPGPYGGTSNSQTLTITDAALSATNTTLSGTEGLGLTSVLVASFTDPGSDGTAADYTATVTWDDGNGLSHTSAGTIVATGANTFNVYASNTVAYAEEGTHAVTVTISDKGGSSVTAGSSVNVADAALTASANAVNGVEGATFTGVVASFTDADPNMAAGDYSAVITWGDGQTSTGTISVNPSGGFNVSGSHAYAEEGSYSVGVKITDAGGASASVTGSAGVTDAALTPSGMTVTPLEGNAFSGVVASFTDADPNAVAGDFTATITWGDGHTSTGTVTGNGSGGFSVTGANTYAEEGPFAISVQIADAGGASATANSTANVADATLSASGMTVNPIEGNLFSGTVATFTDADPFGTATDYTATINWGDGNTSAGTIVDNGNGTFSVTGSHTYSEEGSTAVTVTIRDLGGSNTVASANSTALTVDAPLNASGNLVAATEGATFNGVVASFVDTDLAAPMNDYTAVIHWGDGLTSTATFSANGTGGMNVAGSHVYAEEGTYTLSVTIMDKGGSSVTVSGTANVADAALAATALAVNATEGTSFTGAVASFTDADPNGAAADYTATISWGDGTTSAGTIAANGSGGFTVTGTHNYAEEGSYAVSVSIGDAGGASASSGSTASVADAALTASGSSLASTEGAVLNGVVASFTDADPGAVAADFTATITWGDGHTSTGTIAPNGSGGFNVSGSNTYAEEGNYNISVAISDAGGAKTSAASTAAVGDAVLSATGASISSTEGANFSGMVASFTDADPNGTAADYTATISWGDGSSSAETINAITGGFGISGTHSYAEEGTYNISVQITETGGATVSTTSKATVADAALAATAVNVSATEGASFSGLVASFTDANPNATAGDFTATIYWGDGTNSAGTVVASNGGFNVTGSHTYAEEGALPVSVTIADVGSASANVSSTANVADASLAVTGAAPLSTEGNPFSGVVATFTDADPAGSASDYKALIFWGDGTTTVGTISANSGSGFSVSGSHSYAEEGSYSIKVSVTDVGGATASGTGTATVVDAALGANAGPLTAIEGTGYSGVLATFIDANPNATAADFTATITWGDGHTSAGTISANANGSFSVTGSNTYAEEGNYTFTVKISDVGGTTDSISAGVTVGDAALNASAASVSASAGTSFSGVVATFTDGNPNASSTDFSATITWGDGSSSAGTVSANSSGGFNVSGTHTYGQPGSYPFTVQITDDGGASAMVQGTASVKGGDTLTASGTTVNATEGLSFTAVVANFTDSNPAAKATDFSASISWGDGSTSTEAVSANGTGGFKVSGTHVYVAEGSDAITVLIHGPAGSTAQANSSATVADSVPVVHASLRHGHNPHEVFVTVNFSDSAREDHQLLINWGDGTTSLIDLGVGNGGTYVVSHLYHGHLRHHLQIVVTVLDDDGTSSAPVALTVNFNEGHHHHHHHHEEGSVWDRSDWDGFSWES
jgi:hypothetical protein